MAVPCTELSPTDGPESSRADPTRKRGSLRDPRHDHPRLIPLPQESGRHFDSDPRGRARRNADVPGLPLSPFPLTAPRPLASIVGLASRQCAPLAQLDRATDYESVGQVFESPRARHFFPRVATPPSTIRCRRLGRRRSSNRPWSSSGSNFGFAVSGDRIASEQLGGRCRRRCRCSAERRRRPVSLELRKRAGQKGPRVYPLAAARRAFQDDPH